MGKPVLLTVDDDPGVSRAVARDLRRRYGENYRVVRADSALDALDALKEIKRRGEPVAAILADYRMPQMNGVEFLEQAMDLFPRARRALLTAYADTDAAIQAINVVDVDHYLLKPWDPPEEKLYPVVDALVETWRAIGETGVEQTKVIGHRWSAPSYQARDFLARNAVPYRWYSVDDPEGQRLLDAAGATVEDIPVVITADGRSLRQPSDAEIAAAVGLSTQPAATLVMLARKLGDGIRIVKDYDRELPTVPAYPAELNQVWTNLIDNAADAMHGEGTLTVRTTRDGEFALVEIGDTGDGVPPEAAKRIFEPFFTTKPVGQGTGLGLDVSWRVVVNRHHGDLQLQSQPGDTRFQVRLPLQDRA